MNLSNQKRLCGAVAAAITLAYLPGCAHQGDAVSAAVQADRKAGIQYNGRGP